jgi:hypothetical protein
MSSWEIPGAAVPSLPWNFLKEDRVRNFIEERLAGPHSLVSRTTHRGTTHTDITIVEAFVEALQAGKQDSSFEYEIVKNLDQMQLRFLVHHLAATAREYRRLIDFSFTKPHLDLVKQLHDLREIAKKQGVDLWPELEKRS